MRQLKLLAIVSLMALPLAGWSHSQSLNKDGCHKGENDVGYHCHQGKLKDRQYASQEAAQKALIQEAITPKKQSSAGEVEVIRDPS